MRFKTLLITLTIAAALAALPASAAPRSWEQQKTERTDARQAAKWSEVEVKTVRGAIIVTNSTKVQIKIFTILGQLVSSETLAPGIWQFNMPAHGVYIVKANDLTCKVAV